MLSKVMTIAAAGLVSFGMLSSQATTTIVIGDFEGPGVGQLDGWTVTGSYPAFAGDDIGAVWSSTGNGAMAVNFTDAAFSWNLQLSDVSIIAGLASQAPGAGLVMADVHWEAGDWAGPASNAWVRWDTISMNSAAGWKQTNDGDMNDTGVWNPGVSPTETRTIIWDVSSYYGPGDKATIEGGGWGQLNLSMNGADTGGGFLYIDNIRVVVPEPGTLALLGMGGLLMVVRRRRA